MNDTFMNINSSLPTNGQLIDVLVKYGKKVMIDTVIYHATTSKPIYGRTSSFIKDNFEYNKIKKYEYADGSGYIPDNCEILGWREHKQN